MDEKERKAAQNAGLLLAMIDEEWKGDDGVRGYWFGVKEDRRFEVSTDSTDMTFDLCDLAEADGGSLDSMKESFLEARDWDCKDD